MKTLLLPSAFVVFGLVLASGAAPPDEKPPVIKKAKLTDNVTLEIEGDKRRVVIDAYVCMRQGPLEQLLTRKKTKEHESVLAAEIDARVVHLALEAAGAVPGSPVKFRPKPAPASGTVIKITLEYRDKQGKLQRVPAQQWIRSFKSKKDLAHDWVFAGSTFFLDPEKKRPPFYCANDGDVICVANFDTAMLDLPIDSTKDNEDLAFEAHTERIPELNTPVRVILEPVLPPKKK